MKKYKVKAVCFDMWGTLAEGGNGKEWIELQKIIGASSFEQVLFRKEGVKSLLSHSWPLEDGIRNLAAKFKLKLDKKTVTEGYKFWWGLVNKSKLYPETLAVLKRLQSMQLRLILMSNSEKESIKFKLRETEIDKYFEKLFISGEIGSLKHENKMFELADKYLSLPKQEVLMVDDTFDHGVIPARNFGWKTLWLTRGKSRSEQFQIEDLRGIFAYL